MYDISVSNGIGDLGESGRVVSRTIMAVEILVGWDVWHLDRQRPWRFWQVRICDISIGNLFWWSMKVLLINSLL